MTAVYENVTPALPSRYFVKHLNTYLSGEPAGKQISQCSEKQRLSPKNGEHNPLGISGTGRVEAGSSLNTLPSISSLHSSGGQISFQAVLDDRAEGRRGNHLRQIREMEGFGKSGLWENESKIWP